MKPPIFMNGMWTNFLKNMSLKKLHFSLLFLLLSHSALAQVDTIYYNQFWQKTPKYKAWYYRPTDFPIKDGKYLIKDYFLNGQLQMEGWSLSATEDIFDGMIKWYDAKGQLATSKTYTRGHLNGETIYYANGNIYTVGQYKEERMYSGTFPSEYDDFQKTQYKDGHKIKELNYFTDSLTIARERLFIPNSDTVQVNYFDKKKGLVSSALFYSSGSVSYLQPLSGTIQLYALDKHGFAKAIVGQTKINNLSKPNSNERLASLSTTLNNYGHLQGEVSNYKHYKGSIAFQKSGQIITYSDKGTRQSESCCFSGLDIDINGEYKEGMFWNGSFYFPGYEINSFKDGIANGLQINYNENFDVVNQLHFENGQFEGLRKTYNPYDGKYYEVIYKNNQPFSGSYYEYNHLMTFKDGFESREIEYSNAIHYTITYYVKSKKYNVIQPEKTIYVYDNHVDSLVYSDGFPYNGREYSSPNKWKTYDNGKITGPYYIHTENFEESGHYLNHKKNGLVTVVIDGKIFEGHYKLGKITDGYSYTPYNQSLIAYKDGLKDGLAITDSKLAHFAIDSTVTRYKKDQPVGQTKFYYQGRLIGTGTYKKGKPYSGDFYTDETHAKYKNGQIQYEESILPFSDRKLASFYNKGQLTKQTWTKPRSEQIDYTLLYKNGEIWQGVQYVEEKKSGRPRITHFSNGMKNGAQITYSVFNSDKKLSEYHFVNNQRDGQQSDYITDSIILRSDYKNGQLYNGSSIFQKGIQSQIIHVAKNGQLIEEQLISSNVFDIQEDKILKGFYKNGKKFNGYFYTIYPNDKTTVDFYKNGQKHFRLMEPEFHWHKEKDQILESPARAHYQDNLEIIERQSQFTKEYNYTVTIKPHEANKYSINYIDSASVIFGQLAAENNKIVALDIKRDIDNADGLMKIKIYLGQNNKVYTKMLLQNYGIYALSKNANHIDDPIDLNLYDLDDIILSDHIEELAYYWTDTDELIMTLRYKNGKELEGTTIRNAEIGEDGQIEYLVTTYKNGEVDSLDYIKEKDLRHKSNKLLHK